MTLGHVWTQRVYATVHHRSMEQIRRWGNVERAFDDQQEGKGLAVPTIAKEDLRQAAFLDPNQCGSTKTSYARQTK